jgi:hypothetical protein
MCRHISRHICRQCPDIPPPPPSPSSPIDFYETD